MDAPRCGNHYHSVLAAASTCCRCGSVRSVVVVARVVRGAVATLKGARRQAVELQCLDHSYGEIAAKLDMTAEAAKSLLYRARNELRESLGPLAESLI